MTSPQVETTVEPDPVEGVHVAVSSGPRANATLRRVAGLARALCSDVRRMHVSAGQAPMDTMFAPAEVDATLAMLGSALVLGPSAGGWLEATVLDASRWSARPGGLEHTEPPAAEAMQPADVRRLRRAELLGIRLNAPVVAVHVVGGAHAGTAGTGPFPLHAVAVSHAPAARRERLGRAWAWLHARTSVVVVARLATATATLHLARTQTADLVAVGLRHRSWLDAMAWWFSAPPPPDGRSLCVHVEAPDRVVRASHGVA